MPEKQPAIDISDYGVLSEALTPSDTTINKLARTAENLLEHVGISTLVNGEPARVTNLAVPVSLRDQPLYARLAYPTTRPNTLVDMPAIIFCTNKNTDNITTNDGYFSALLFNGGKFEGTHLIAGNGHKPAVDDPEHVTLANTIIQGLTDQYKDVQQKERAAQAAQEKADRETIEQRKARLRGTGKVLGSLTAATVLLYGPQVIQHDTIDARSGWMVWPDVVEWIVDAANYSEHIAQGYSKPPEARTLHPGQTVTALPVIPSFGKQEVINVDANRDSHDGSHVAGKVEPGLYQTHFSIKDASAVKRLDADGCYTVKGDFANGRTSVFTNSRAFNESAYIKVVSNKEAEVCLRAIVPRDFHGTAYFYEEKS